MRKPTITINLLIGALALATLIPAAAPAQAPALSPVQTPAPLADRIPADAIAYFGMHGLADPAAGYEGSHLQAILDHSEFPKLIHQSLPRMIERISDQSPAAAQIVQIITALGHPLLNHPMAFYFGPVYFADNRTPVFHIALLCDAGEDAAAMTDKAMSLVEMAGHDMPVQLFVKSFGNLVVISTFEWAERPAHPLSADPRFQASFNGMSAPPVAAIYVNLENAYTIVNNAVAASHDPDAMRYWPRIRTALGLDQLRGIATWDSFENRDFVSQTYVDSPAPRTGLAVLIDERPISDDLLKKIPATAVMASAGRLDLSRLMEQVHRGVTAISPSAGLTYDQYMQQVGAIIGMDLQLDLIGAIGSEWAVYIDPAIAGNDGLGAVLINHPPDAAKLESSLTKFETTTNATIGALLRMAAPFITLEFQHEQIDGLNVHYAAVPLFTPSWAMSDGYMYIGLYPQVVVSAAKAAHAAAGKSILDNPSYQALRKRLGGPAQITAFTYLDTPHLAAKGYSTVLFLSRLVLGAGDVFGLHSPAMVVPELSTIVPELEPEGSIEWVDDSGLHAKGLEAFPGDEILATNSNSTSTFLQFFSIIINLGMQQGIR